MMITNQKTENMKNTREVRSKIIQCLFFAAHTHTRAIATSTHEMIGSGIKLFLQRTAVLSRPTLQARSYAMSFTTPMCEKFERTELDNLAKSFKKYDGDGDDCISFGEFQVLRMERGG
jgi:hypothetical protein